MQRASRDFTHIFIINFVQRPGFTKRMGEKKIDKYIEREPHTTFKQRTPNPPQKKPYSGLNITELVITVTLFNVIHDE